MKKFAICYLLFAIFAAPAARANALWDLYGGAGLGVGGASVYSDGNTHSMDAQTYFATLGIDLPIFRIELEYDYLNDADMKTNMGMLNGYIKMPTAILIPYAGAGVGVAFGGDLADSGTAYQGMVGLTLDLEILPLKFDIEGRLVYAPNMSVQQTTIKPDLLQYEGRIKARFVF
jgi:opacity protein-like surface antigen